MCGRRCETYAFVAWTTRVQEIWPRGVVSVHGRGADSDDDKIAVTGVRVWRVRFRAGEAAASL